MKHIIFFPGWSEQSTQFSELFALMRQDGWTIHSLNHSHSRHRDSSFILDDKTIEARKLLEKIPADEHCLVIGHSVGCLQAALIADHPKVDEVLMFSPVGVTPQFNVLSFVVRFLCKQVYDLLRALSGRISAKHYATHSFFGTKHFFTEPSRALRELLIVTRGHSVRIEKPLYIILPRYDPLLNVSLLKRTFLQAKFVYTSGGHDELLYRPAETYEIVRRMR